MNKVKPLLISSSAYYYRNIATAKCQHCGITTTFLLLRFRTYLLKKMMIFPTRNTYYLICSNCFQYNEVLDEFQLIKILHKSRGQTPQKYKNISEPNVKEHEGLKEMIKGHLNDMI